MSQRAVAEAQQTGQPERAALWEAGAAVEDALFGEAAEARTMAVAALELSHDRDVSYGAAFALALSGDLRRSQAIAHDLESQFPEDTSVRVYLSADPSRLVLHCIKASLPKRSISFGPPRL